MSDLGVLVHEDTARDLHQILELWRSGQLTRFPRFDIAPPAPQYDGFSKVVRLMEPLYRGQSAVAEVQIYSPENRDWRWIVEYAGFMDFTDLTNQFLIRVNNEPVQNGVSADQILVLPNTTAEALGADIFQKTRWQNAAYYGPNYTINGEEYNFGLWAIEFVRTAEDPPQLIAVEESGNAGTIGNPIPYTYTLNGSCEIRYYNTSWRPSSEVIRVVDYLEHYPEVVINAGSIVHCFAIPGVGWCPGFPAYRDFVTDDQ